MKASNVLPIMGWAWLLGAIISSFIGDYNFTFYCVILGNINFVGDIVIMELKGGN